MWLCFSTVFSFVWVFLKLGFAYFFLIQFTFLARLFLFPSPLFPSAWVPAFIPHYLLFFTLFRQTVQGLIPYQLDSVIRTTVDQQLIQLLLNIKSFWHLHHFFSLLPLPSAFLIPAKSLLSQEMHKTPFKNFCTFYTKKYTLSVFEIEITDENHCPFPLD